MGRDKNDQLLKMLACPLEEKSGSQLVTPVQWDASLSAHLFGWKPVLECLCVLVWTTGLVSSVAATSRSAGRPHKTGSGFLEIWCWLLEWSSGQRVEWLHDRWPASMELSDHNQSWSEKHMKVWLRYSCARIQCREPHTGRVPAPNLCFLSKTWKTLV